MGKQISVKPVVLYLTYKNIRTAMLDFVRSNQAVPNLRGVEVAACAPQHAPKHPHFAKVVTILFKCRFLTVTSMNTESRNPNI